MDNIKQLRKSLDKAAAALRRAKEAYSTCMLNSDHSGCAAEQDAVTRAEHEVSALRHRIAAAERLAGRETA
jgi:hypothetical protein